MLEDAGGVSSFGIWLWGADSEALRPMLWVGWNGGAEAGRTRTAHDAMEGPPSSISARMHAAEC